MRILLLGHVDPNHDNGDESAVAYALRQLGHDVTECQERKKFRSFNPTVRTDFDFCLAFKWENHEEIEAMKVPVVFYYFDLISSQEPSLAARMLYRREWYKRVEPYMLVGFFTDGEFCREHPDKCCHLMQGADEQRAGPGTPAQGFQNCKPILFTGMIHHGQRRVEHITHLREQYREQLEILGDSGPRFRIHGRQLADRIASSKVVVAPDNPISAHYHSNRVYLTLGFGGFLLHPDNETIREHYKSGQEIQLYSSWQELDDLIDYYLKDENEGERQRLMKAGYERTLKSNLYRHRCEELVKIVKERL